MTDLREAYGQFINIGRKEGFGDDLQPCPAEAKWLNHDEQCEEQGEGRCNGYFKGEPNGIGYQCDWQTTVDYNPDFCYTMDYTQGGTCSTK